LTLDALLPRAAGEGRRAALISGEPGSGKSRLVRELAGRLSQEGALVLYGACDAVVQAPYGPVVEALNTLVRGTKRDTLRSAVGAGGRDLARILPDLPSILGDLPALAAADADAERHRLRTAVTDLLTAVAEQQPVLLVLEDLHWADTPTLHLVRHLVRAGAEARLLLVATFRDVEAEMSPALTETLADLARSEGVLRVRLEGLSGEEVAEFVKLATGSRAGPDVVEAIGALTDGNAFLLTELWRDLVDGGWVEIGPDVVRLGRSIADIGTPETVREVVSHRITRLEPATGDVLSLAAVIGATFELETVSLASDLPEEVVLAAVEEAVRSGLVEEEDGHRLAFRFTHELVRRSVSDRVSVARRADLHLRVAGALEQTPSTTDARGRLAALAHHYAEAARVGGHEKAVSYNLLAADSAAAALAFDEAVDHLSTALALGVEDRHERGLVCLDLGYACHRAGRSLDALASFREAAAAGRTLGHVELLARAAIGFEEACWRPAIHDEGAIELLQEAVVAVGNVQTGLRVRVLGALTRALDFHGDYLAAAVARDEATAIARAIGDRAALGWVLSSSYWSRGARSHQEINAMLTEAVAIGEELGDAEMLAEALWWLVPSQVALCDHDAARAALDRLFDFASTLNEPFRMHVAEHYRSALALCDGDLAAADAAALRSREWSRLLTGRDASAVHGIQMFGIRREQGRLGELAPLVRMLGTSSREAAWSPGLVALLAELGMEEAARRELQRIRSDGIDALRHQLWLGTLTYVTDACAALGETEVAKEVYAELEPYSGSNVQIGHLVSCYGSADRYLGMLAATLGEWSRAEDHFQAALELNARLGATTWLAHTQLEYARMALSRGGSADRQLAAKLLGDAVAAAETFGLPNVLAKVAALGTTVASGQVMPAGLSARELEVLRLVARGLSNREIGTRIFISEHTAANHVRSILRKTECANRTEAAAYAHRRGLVSA
jgi:DNA-binding CsgD family transcriptional regulator/tetratricopeptide (TPR) repeat protein